MYTLNFEITMDHDDPTAGLRFCDDLALPLASSHPGFVSGMVMNPVHVSDVVRLVTIWNDKTTAENFEYSASFQDLASSMKDLGLVLSNNDAHDLHRWEFARAGQVRHIRSSVPPERLDEVAQFWRENGRQVIESATGCIRAHGFVDREANEFVLVIWWRSAKDAEAFRLSEYHEQEFVLPLGEDVERLTRSHLEPLESKLLADSRK